MRVRLQRSRAMQPVSDETLATYTAARAFLFGEWFGATLMVASYTLLYAFTLGARLKPLVTLPVCLGLLVLGAAAFLRSRTIYLRLDFAWARRWHAAAGLVAGSAAFFWSLFAFLEVLAFYGVRVGP
ncbi:MAG: hypothetical protein ACYDBQ_04225 [Thermoplasmatota archaeon]